MLHSTSVYHVSLSSAHKPQDFSFLFTVALPHLCLILSINQLKTLSSLHLMQIVGRKNWNGCGVALGSYLPPKHTPAYKIRGFLQRGDIKNISVSLKLEFPFPK